ncbi:hypothetical protein MHYP_G00165560 [Metynnis hypsauchen]
MRHKGLRYYYIKGWCCHAMCCRAAVTWQESAVLCFPPGLTASVDDGVVLSERGMNHSSPGARSNQPCCHGDQVTCSQHSGVSMNV